jgi:uncharacterized delta-60 repeat protein
MTRPARPLRLEALEDRTTPTLALDPTFGTGGTLGVNVGYTGGGVDTVVQPDGKIVVSSFSDSGENAPPYPWPAISTGNRLGIAVFRFNPDGSPDPTFGNGGRVNLVGGWYIPTNVALAPDGAIYVSAQNLTTDPLPPGDPGYGGLFRLKPDGSSDTSFGGDGLVGALEMNISKVEDLAVQPDGKVVIVGVGAGAAHDTFAATRLNPDGSLDTTFNGNGTFSLSADVTGPTSGYIISDVTTRNVHVQADGKLVFEGQRVLQPATLTPKVDSAAFRLNPDGSLDTTFDGDGIWVEGQGPAGFHPDSFRGLAVQPDGKLLLLGSEENGTGVGSPVVVRLNPDGSTDTGFGTGGAAALPENWYYTASFVVLPDGRIVLSQQARIGSSSRFEGPIAVLNPDGTIAPFPGGADTYLFNYSDTGDGGADFESMVATVGPEGQIVLATGFNYPTYMSEGGVKLLRIAVLSDQPETPPPPVEPPVTPPAPPPIVPPVEPPRIEPGLPGYWGRPHLPAMTPPPPPGTGETPPPTEPPLPPPPTEPPIQPPDTGEPPPPPRPFQVTLDLNGDGVTDPVVIDGSRVAVVDGAAPAGSTDGPFLVPLFSPFEDGFQGKVNVAVGDLTGDGISDLVVAADSGGGPVVVVYDGAKLAAGVDPSSAQLVRFLGIDDPAFRGGARVAVGDLNHDGTPDLVIAAGIGGGPRMAVYDGKSVAAGTPTRLVADFFAFEATQRDGAFPAIGDINGDGFADVICGGGPNGGPRVLVLDGKMLTTGPVEAAFAAPVADFFAGNPADRNGVLLGITNADGDNRADLVVGDPAAPAAPAHLYRGADIIGAGEPASTPCDPFETATTNGVFVG